ncbi:MAG: hypothetical protein GY870_11155 [archaeon]|nr:hypothetical protein [archaeon]
MVLKRNELEKVISKDFEKRMLPKRIKQELETFSIRLTANDKNVLGRHFDTKGLKLSQGLRMVIKDYMNENELR